MINTDENMNPKDAQNDKPDNDIDPVINPEENESNADVTSGERADYNESLMPEELSGLKGKENNDEAEYTGVPEEYDISEREISKTDEVSDTIDKPEEYDSSEDMGIIEELPLPDSLEESNQGNADGQSESEYDIKEDFGAADKLTPEEKDRINKYKKFKKVDGSTYRRVNQFLRKHTYITAREWAIARLCADFSTRGGAEMTFIGENLPELIPFMTDTYSPQAVNQARSSFKKKVKKSGATFFYGALCGFFTADELDDILFESSEVARFLLEIEGTSVDLDDEIDIEDKITDVMRSVAEASSMIRAPKTVSDEPEDNFEYEDIPEEKIHEECYSEIEGIAEDSDIKDE
ncbi:DUF5806 family protein [Methanoplanus limicola]|uniref:Uncharacterized protein n=1 Tax=Methanoplanus limicola DSM 2279 TaxID=937775 RepID=H1Z475_9EURY|nr:DUF5806 family protein [Methanoplanus limicola]EHQ35754.1 hypothetical protein Metlim_1653 [Methanoplanus limicola DSM 2279]